MTIDRKKKLTAAAFALAVLVAVALVTASVVVSPRIEAADCGDGNGGGSFHRTWDLTPDAAARTAAGDCPNGGTCKEWCAHLCGQSEPLGIFACFF